MEGDKDNEDVQVVLPPKEKKLKQTRLPFQMMLSSGSPNTSTKKRKLSSPSPNNSKGSKVQKTGKKENSIIKNPEIIEIDLSDDKNGKKDESESSEMVVDSPDILDRTKDSKKPDGKSAMKPGALTRLFQKAAAASPAKSPVPPSPSPVVENTKSKIEDVAEKSNDVSNDSSDLEPLPDSDKDEDQNSMDKTQDSNPESESEESLSSDDNNQDDKKTNDKTEETEKASSDVNIEKLSIVDKQIEAVQAKKRQLTPKQIEKRSESARKRELLQEAKAERERQILLDKIQRRKEREERRQELKQKKEADIEAKKKEKEQKEMKKQLENEQKQKEREQKEKAKEEEKRKKEEEKLELERKKQKAASTFVSFFVPKKLDNKLIDDDKIIKKLTCNNFMPFEVKADMKVAPTCRRNLNDNDKLNFDSTCLNNLNQSPTQLWLDEIRKNKINIRKTGKTWPAEAKDDIIILEEEDDGNVSVLDEPTTVTEKQRAKLLSFKENRRPPYWGTWRKKSDKINPKKPFNKDTKWFDYEVDSDEEWEEEEPGESLHGSDDEKEEENADDNEYDVDNEFMVPHGYLSDEEIRPDEEDEEDMTPETQKFKLKILGEEFEAEMKEKTAPLKPRVVGIFWQNSGNGYPENAPERVVKLLTARQAWFREAPIVLIKPVEQDASNNSDNLNEKSRGGKKTKVPDEAVSHLIQLIHGNTYKQVFLIKEFITYWCKTNPDDDILSKASVRDKIKELAKRIPCPDEGIMYQKYCWYVAEEIRKQYNSDDLKLPNQWSYILTPKTEKLDKDKKDKIEKESKDKDRKTGASLITQFTQKITPDEFKKQLIVKPPTSPSANSSSPLNRPPKRATLISVPRGEPLPTEISKINITQTNN